MYVLPIDVICRSLAYINRSHSFIEWHHIYGIACCSTWFMASTTYPMSCPNTSFSLNSSIGFSITKPLSICFLVFLVLSNPSKYVSHLSMISLHTVSIWPSKLLMKGISEMCFVLVLALTFENKHEFDLHYLCYMPVIKYPVCTYNNACMTYSFTCSQ